MSDTFLDRANACTCPKPVIELLDLAVRYAEASLGSAHPDAVLGAQYVKTFMEQPAPEWCRYIRGDMSDVSGFDVIRRACEYVVKVGKAEHSRILQARGQEALAAVDAVEAELSAAREERDYWHGQARNRAFRNARAELDAARRREHDLREALGAIQAVAVTAQNHHVDASVRLDWLREIENRARAASPPAATKELDS